MACTAAEALACDVPAPGTAYGLSYLAPKKKVGSGVLTEGQDRVELQREVTGVDGERRRAALCTGPIYRAQGVADSIYRAADLGVRARDAGAARRSRRVCSARASRRGRRSRQVGQAGQRLRRGRGLRKERRRQVGPVGRGRRARVTQLSGEMERARRGSGMRVLLGRAGEPGRWQAGPKRWGRGAWPG